MAAGVDLVLCRGGEGRRGARPGRAAAQTAQMAAQVEADRLAGNEAWGKTLAKAIADEPLCETVVDALRPMANLRTPVDVDLAAVKVESKREEMKTLLLREGCSEFDVEFAMAIWVYTMQEPAVYQAMNAALREAANRDEGHDAVPEAVRHCLPYIKFLDYSMENAPAKFRFTGRCFRGDQFVWPSKEEHDPESYFQRGREFSWHEFKSTSMDKDVALYHPSFCGERTGPRTIFIIEGVFGVKVETLSDFKSEAEVLFPVNAKFRVTFVQKKLKHDFSGFPDEVHLEPPRTEVLSDEITLPWVRHGEADFETELGSGTYATVYGGTYRFGSSRSTPVAFKLFHRSQNVNRGLRQQITSEATKQKLVNDRNIIRLFGVTEVPERGLALVLELASGGSLEKILHDVETHETIPWNLRIKWLVEIASGLEALHGLVPTPIIHRDLKAANVLMSSRTLDVAVPKIADFGVAETVRTNAATFGSAGGGGGVGTWAWKAPETFRRKYSPKSDVFALGMTTYEVLSRQIPWDGCRQEEIMEMARKAFEVNDEILEHYPEERQRAGWEQKNPLEARRPDLDPFRGAASPEGLTDLIERCWADEPGARPGLAEFKEELSAVWSKSDECQEQIANPFFAGGQFFEQESPHNYIQQELPDDTKKPARTRLKLFVSVVSLALLSAFAFLPGGADDHQALGESVGASGFQQVYPRIEFCANYDCSPRGWRLNATDLGAGSCKTQSCTDAECCGEYPSCDGFDCSESPNEVIDDSNFRCSHSACTQSECCSVLPALENNCRQGVMTEPRVLADGSTIMVCGADIPYCDWRPDPCRHGVCHSIDRDHYSCNCSTGWSGRRCQASVPFCQWNSNPCHHGGACSSTERDDYSCVGCDAGWTGTTCNDGIPFCEWNTNPCDHNGQCVSAGHLEFTCTCSAGWRGSNCSEPIPYCEWNDDPCEHGGVCRSDGRDQFLCENCDAGWTGRSCGDGMPWCEWNDNPCLHDAACVSDGRDGHTCSGCTEGWTGQNCDEDIPFCDWNASPCANDGSCTSTGRNSYSCTCSAGWRGSDCSEPIPYCEWNDPCEHDGVCQSDGRDQFLCESCAAGWTGRSCSDGRPWCEWNDNPCLHGATCVSDGRDGHTCSGCNRETGWTGRHCDEGLPFCEWNPNPCENSGTCVSTGQNTYSCDCSPGWRSTSCTDPIPYCDWHSDVCEHGGVCRSDGRDQFTCENCGTGWTGRSCSEGIPWCDWNDSPCQHGGTCSSVSRDGHTCTGCDDGWTGQDCDQEQPFCARNRNPCANGGTCVSIGRDSFSCTCQRGWTGDSCGEAEPYCDWNPNPCQNGGDCTSVGRDRYTCVCTDDRWTGDNCEVGDPCTGVYCGNGVCSPSTGACDCDFGYTDTDTSAVSMMTGTRCYSRAWWWWPLIVLAVVCGCGCVGLLSIPLHDEAERSDRECVSEHPSRTVCMFWTVVAIVTFVAVAPSMAAHIANVIIGFLLMTVMVTIVSCVLKIGEDEDCEPYVKLLAVLIVVGLWMVLCASYGIWPAN
eukprot:COSAG04_NODE_2013_length_4999_cov_66.515510_1_plen_1522_part_00